MSESWSEMPSSIAVGQGSVKLLSNDVPSPVRDGTMAGASGSKWNAAAWGWEACAGASSARPVV